MSFDMRRDVPLAGATLCESPSGSARKTAAMCPAPRAAMLAASNQQDFAFVGHQRADRALLAHEKVVRVGQKLRMLRCHGHDRLPCVIASGPKPNEKEAVSACSCDQGEDEVEMGAGFPQAGQDSSQAAGLVFDVGGPHLDAFSDQVHGVVFLRHSGRSHKTRTLASPPPAARG